MLSVFESQLKLIVSLANKFKAEEDVSSLRTIS